MSYLFKKDNNHNEIVKQWQTFGFITIDTSWSRGKMLDFIAYKMNEIGVWFIEVKNGKEPLTILEKEFIAKHPERSIVIRSKDENMSIIASIEARF
jgi:3'-phosphoadenosine 5'-phosphosulfate sulfotransferase (PAPS reductase)/FAD synthetase